MLANSAQAQDHGFAQGVTCESPVRVCDTAGDCSDGNACTAEFCDTESFTRGTLECTWTVTHDDDFNDTLSILGAFSHVKPFTDPTRVPAVGNAPIVAVSGNTSCVAGAFAPCTIGPDVGSGPGSVSFRNNPDYNPTPSDPSPLPMQATAIVQDLCDGSPSDACPPPVGGPLSFGAITTLVDGCSTPEPVVCDDGDACTGDSCDPGTGECVSTPGFDCDDGDLCTDDSCDPETGACVNVPADPRQPGCAGVEICRTAGFWGAHGGDEKAPKSQNITQAVIDAAGGLAVCGTTIANTALGSSQSAIEALCVAVKGDVTRQLVRQLTAAALNCALADCSQAHADLIAACNDSCTGSGGLSVSECIHALDCFNGGGTWDGDSCGHSGLCEDSGEGCASDEDCVGVGDYCVPTESCHDRHLCPDATDDGEINGSDFCFEPPGPAGSPGKCNAARKNEVQVP
jgi:hypothetical protein